MTVRHFCPDHPPPVVIFPEPGYGPPGPGLARHTRQTGGQAGDAVEEMVRRVLGDTMTGGKQDGVLGDALLHLPAPPPPPPPPPVTTQYEVPGPEPGCRSLATETCQLTAVPAPRRVPHEVCRELPDVECVTEVVQVPELLCVPEPYQDCTDVAKVR